MPTTDHKFLLPCNLLSDVQTFARALTIIKNEQVTENNWSILLKMANEYTSFHKRDASIELWWGIRIYDADDFDYAMEISWSKTELLKDIVPHLLDHEIKDDTVTEAEVLSKLESMTEEEIQSEYGWDIHQTSLLVV